MPNKKAPPTAGRPIMPADYGIQPPDKASGLLSWAEAGRKIAAAHNYWVSTTRPDGRPHAMPVWGVWVRETLLFSTGRASRKGRNLAQQPYVVVHLESGDDVVILEGIVQEALDPQLLAEFVDAYDAKYKVRPDTTDPNKVTYALRPQVALAWLESDFVGGATRWQFA